MFKLTGSVLLFTLAFLPCFNIHHFYNETVVFVPASSNQDKTSAHQLFAHKTSVELRREKSRVSDFSKDPKCTMAPDSRFDCARDSPVSKAELWAELLLLCPCTRLHRGCFYPALYGSYRMGPLTPTRHGQTATLTRAAPSYLPRDVSVLQLDVTEEATDCLHITVSACKTSFDGYKR